MSDGKRLTFCFVSSFFAHAAILAFFPHTPETAPAVRARKGKVRLVIRRRRAQSPRRPSPTSHSPRLPSSLERKRVPSAKITREALVSDSPPVREPSEREGLEPLFRELLGSRLSEEEPPVREESGVTNARLLGDAKPPYPACCQSGSCNRGKGREDFVRLEVEVLPSGGAGGMRILRKAGCPGMNRAAEMFFRRARFVPATRAGEPTGSTKVWRVTFELEER